MTAIPIDVDQHLFESRTTWSDHIDPAFRDDALRIVDDERGWPWLAWRGEHLYPVEIQHPGKPEDVGRSRHHMDRGDEAPGTYEDLLPASYATPAGRLDALDAFDIGASVVFPNFGLVWEDVLASDPAARRANMRAYNRWIAGNVAEGKGRLFGVAHLTLDDADWVRTELSRLEQDGIRLAMIAPAPVNGRALSHDDLDPVWTAFCEHGIAPVFHVAAFHRALHPCWYEGDPEMVDPLIDSVFLSVAPSVAIANMILNGTLERFPDLRLGIVELTATWVPSFLLNLDGAFDFYALRHGGPHHHLQYRPSEYFLRQVRVSALPYEDPARLVHHVGESTFMIGSDWPHAEGVEDPRAAAERATEGLDDTARDGLLGANAAWLLGI